MKELDRTLLQRLSQLKSPYCPSVGTLGDFLDGKVSPEKRPSLEAHLQACPSCVNRLIDLRELARLEKEGEKPPRALVRELKLLVPPRRTLKELVLSVFRRITFPERPARSEPVLVLAQPTAPYEIAKPTAPPTKGLGSSILGSATLSAIWAAVRQWLTPRFIGEIAAASAVAVLVLFVGINTLQQQPPGTQGREVIKALMELTTSEQSVLGSLSLALADPLSIQKRVTSALEKLPKTLVLEQTRGTTNVEVYKKAAPATVLVVTDQSLGSGAVISSQGEVLTNWHVIQGAGQVAVVFKPKRGVEIKKELAFAAIPIKVDQVADLALLKLQAPPKDLSYLPLGNMAKVEVGEDVHAIGHPEGEVWMYTTGIISQIRPRYQWTGLDGLLHQSKVIQTQTALNPGNSGGPLLNDRAEIIGINSFRGEGEGLNYAVAADVVKEFLQRTESRVAAPVPSPRPSAYRMEPYGTNIVGVYVNARVPPPDVWLVYRNAREQPAYAATRGVMSTKIDTVVQGGDPQWQSLAYYVDGDCDGKIDLIGYDANGDGTIDRYRLPEGLLQVASLAKELAQALQEGIIPYPQVRICR